MGQELIAGAAVGLFQNLIGHPFDTAKVLLQMGKNPFKLGPRQLYRGMVYPITMDIISHGTLFPINAWYAKHFSDKYICGALTGLTITPLCYVFDVLKLRRQVEMCHQNTLHGLGMATVRKTAFFGIWLGGYAQLVDQHKIPPFYAGGMIGVTAWTLTYPFDIIKTRQIVSKCDILSSIKQGSLWQGYGMCMARACLVNSVGFYVYDKIH